VASPSLNVHSSDRRGRRSAAPRWSRRIAAPSAHKRTDERSELKIANTVSAATAKRALNATSYNGVALLTGEVPIRRLTHRLQYRGVDGGRAFHHNDLAIGPLTAVFHRTNDTFITSKVKAAVGKRTNFRGESRQGRDRTRRCLLMGIVRHQEGNDARRSRARRRVSPGHHGVQYLIDVPSMADDDTKRYPNRVIPRRSRRCTKPSA